ncbi:unnamed protein product [Cyclocybe aegerita]|uniref:HTH CENPB-type domain-containing protein n=1 Tax=Cyclocybe aegerita TaxID=1973307 RepID=A0A8S0VXU2_CYCAE|nr:unnamed protein product [Cyclocybe aegerita]
MASPYSPYDHARRSRTRSSCTFPPRAPSPTLSSVSAQTSTGSGSRGESSREPALRPKEKHHKHRLRDIDRKNICLHHLQNPNARQEDIGAVFGVERSTISKILKEKEKWLNISEEEEKDENSAKHRPSKFPEVEEEMLKSLQAWSDRGTSITDQLIRSRALEIAKSFQIPPEKFKGSSGWIENFKHRHDIKRGEWAKAVKHAGYPVGGTVGASVNTQPPPAGIPPTPVLTPYDHQRLDGGSGAEQQYKSVDGSGRLVSQWSSDAGNGASHPAHGVQGMPLDPALHPSPSHSLSSIDSSSSHHSHMDHSPSHSHLHSQHPAHSQHEHVLDHQHSQSQQDLSYYPQQQHSVYAPPPNPRPSLAEAEEAINVLIAYLDTSGQTYIKLHERKILTDIKCAMFNHASGLPYERPP